MTDPSLRAMAPDQREKEHDALLAVVSRLRGAFPDAADGDIERAVRGTYNSFAEAKIRDFVPILVEHAVRDDLGLTPHRT